jgi:hypothetical protein
MRSVDTIPSEGKAIKIGWHLSGNGTMQVAPTVYFSIFLKAPMQNNSPGFNCTPVVVDFNSVGDLMDIVGVEYMSCTGTDANLVLKLDLVRCLGSFPTPAQHSHELSLSMTSTEEGRNSSMNIDTHQTCLTLVFCGQSMRL